MKTQIKLEELAMFIVGYYLFTLLPFSWWWFFVFLLAPDIGMLGYIFGNKAMLVRFIMCQKQKNLVGRFPVVGIFKQFQERNQKSDFVIVIE